MNAAAATVGPNAVTQLLAAFRALGRAADADRVFAAAGADDWLRAAPADMVPEQRAARLHQTVFSALPFSDAAMVMREAGRRTGLYVLTHRIPRPAQWLLRALPAWAAARLLGRMISANAHGFVGDGTLRVSTHGDMAFAITGNPMCAGLNAAEPMCLWHEAVFEFLFQALVSRTAQVRQTACEACGDPACRFSVTW